MIEKKNVELLKNVVQDLKFNVKIPQFEGNDFTFKGSYYSQRFQSYCKPNLLMRGNDNV